MDILLLAQQGALRAETLRQALEVTFQIRATHPLPESFPALSKTWARPFQRLAEQTGLTLSLVQASEALQRFLDPVLQNRAVGIWCPDLWEWR